MIIRGRDYHRRGVRQKCVLRRPGNTKQLAAKKRWNTRKKPPDLSNAQSAGGRHVENMPPNGAFCRQDDT